MSERYILHRILLTGLIIHQVLYMAEIIFSAMVGFKRTGTNIWTDFSYTEKDKASTLYILFQQENEKSNFRANSVNDQQYLHKYIDTLEKAGNL